MTLSGARFAPPAEDALCMDGDVLIPATQEGVITASNAAGIRARIIVEVANGPVAFDADAILADHGIEVIPDHCANG